MWGYAVFFHPIAIMSELLKILFTVQRQRPFNSMNKNWTISTIMLKWLQYKGTIDSIGAVASEELLLTLEDYGLNPRKCLKRTSQIVS